MKLIYSAHARISRKDAKLHLRTSIHNENKLCLQEEDATLLFLTRMSPQWLQTTKASEQDELSEGL